MVIFTALQSNVNQDFRAIVEDLLAEDLLVEDVRNGKLFTEEFALR